MPGRIVLHSDGEGCTADLAARLAACLSAGDVVALTGDLGTGKTRFVEGAARALGYAGRVRSPSFTLLHVYRGRLALFHFDLYRWTPDDREAERAEWEEYLEGDGVTFLEWAERWGGELPERTVHVRLFHEGECRRRIEITGPEEKLEKLREVEGAS